MMIVANRIGTVPLRKSTIDVLPIIKLRHANPYFKCQVIQDFIGAVEGEHSELWHQEHAHIDFDVNGRNVQTFIEHKNVTWKQDIQTGKIIGIPITIIGVGTDPVPTIRTTFTDNDVNDWPNGEDHEDSYFLRIGPSDGSCSDMRRRVPQVKI